MDGINVIKNESKELILEFENGDTTIPDLITAELANMDGVDFVGVDKDHPEVGKPKLVIKTSKKKASEMLEKALDSIDEQFTAIKKGISGK